IRSLGDREPSVRLAALRGLLAATSANGAAGSAELRPVVDALAAILGDPDDGVRLAAIEALGHRGPLVSADPPAGLVMAMEERSAGNRAAAITAVSKYAGTHDPLLPSLLRIVEHDEDVVRMACWRAFARSQPPAFSAAAIPALVKALGSRSRIVRSH